MLSTLILIGLLSVAAVTDITRHKIFNWNTYPGIMLAVIVNYVQSEPPDLPESVIGFLVCGFVMLFCFVLFDVGGGDVKLIAMMGAFLGLEQGIEALLWTLVLGAVVGVVVLIWKVGFITLAARVVHHVAWVFRLGSWLPLNKQERRPLQSKLYLAPVSVVAVLIVKFRVLDW